MTRRLEGKVCIITGSGGGIGRAMAGLFAMEGARVVGADIEEVSAQATVDEVRAQGGDMVSLHPADLTDPVQNKALVDLALRTYGRIDVVVNNAGTAHFGPVDALPLNLWQATIDQELSIVFMLVQAAWSSLTQTAGVIVNIASTAGLIGYKAFGTAAHAAAKGGVIALTRQLAAEGRHHGIRANSISPGLIATPATQGALDIPEIARPMLEKMMRGRPGQPHEVASVALFLASDESSIINAADIPADDGTSAW